MMVNIIEETTFVLSLGGSSCFMWSLHW